MSIISLQCIMLILNIEFSLTPDVAGKTYIDTGAIISREFFHNSHIDSLPQMPGWPKSVPYAQNFPTVGMCFADINNDNFLEILLGTSDHAFHVWDFQGNYMPGWPVAVLNRICSKPAVGDLDPSYPGLEIVIADWYQSDSSYLYAWHADGTNVPGWPKYLVEIGPVISPLLFDLDCDGYLEIIQGQCHYPNGQIIVFRSDGTVYPGWPQILDYMCVATPAVGDVENDGDVEICAVSYKSVYLWDRDGNALPGWPKLEVADGMSYAQPVLADLDNDGDCEILHSYSANNQNYVGIYHHDGSNFLNWPDTFPGPQTYTMPVVADIDNDHDLEIFGGGHVLGAADFLARHHNTDVVSGWPVYVAMLECSPIAFDLDLNDSGRREIIIGDNSLFPGNLYAFNDDGSSVTDWPQLVSGAACPNSPSVGDVDADGDIEIAYVCSRNPNNTNLWTVNGVRFLPYLCEWGTWFHDNWNTGWFHPKAPQNLAAQSGPTGVHLTWDANTEPDIAGYNVWRSESPNDLYSKNKVNNTLITGTEFYDIPPQETTFYYYCVTARIQAETESRLSNEVSGYMGVFEKKSQTIALYSVMPNPFRDVLNFYLPEGIETQINIYDCKGALIQGISCTGSIQWAPKSILPAGVYFVHIQNPGQKIIKKAIKLR